MKDDFYKLQVRQNLQPSSTVGTVNRVWRQMIAEMIRLIQHRSEPRVTKQIDRAGNLYYRVYNPQTGKSATFGCPAEIRWWIEQSG